MPCQGTTRLTEREGNSKQWVLALKYGMGWVLYGVSKAIY